MEHKLLFSSESYPAGQVLGLASGYLSLTHIVFVNEGITVTVEAKKGEVEFFGKDSTKLLSTKVPLPEDGDEKFSEVKCIVEEGRIKLGFPKYTYEDNYPNCDGESDRWTKVIAGYTLLCYDIESNSIVE